MYSIRRWVRPRVCATAIIATCWFASPSEFAGTRTRPNAPDRTAQPNLTIFDQSDRPVPNGVVAVFAENFNVTVAPGGSSVFSPSTVNISAGDTVIWTWAGSNHTVTSGTPCTADSAYCSATNTNCSTAATSNSGATYSHTFVQTGTFHYFCRIHCAFGMTGTVIVSPRISSITRDGNGNVSIAGRSTPNSSVTIKSAPAVGSPFTTLAPAVTDANGVFSYNDGSATAASEQFYRVTSP